ncbi:MAG: hypothetical protein Q9217_000547 [Psora testacea]
MRLFITFIGLDPFLLLWFPAVFLNAEASIPQTPYVPIQTSHIFRDTYSRSWFTRVIDSLIETIWPVPSTTTPHVVDAKTPQLANPPTKLLARHGGDLVLRFQIKSSEEAEALANAIRVLLLDVWEFTAEWVDIRLSKDVVAPLLGLLPPSLQHAHTPLMHDLAQAIFESYPSLTFKDPSASAQQPSRPFSPSLHSSSDQRNIFFRDYQPLSVIYPWMRLLQSLFPTHARLISVGLTYEGRDIHALRVGVHPTNAKRPSDPRKTILVVGGSHAREWISTSTVNYVAYSFITAYGRSKSITKLLEIFDFVFVPILNPDGYVYTWESDRLWRKNRQQTELRFCKGFDLDRSYGFQWDSDSSDKNPCSESFSGETPFEAIEARRFADWARNETENNNVEIAGFLDLHSYSQQVLYPYSFSCTSAPPSLENLEELAIGLAKAIRRTSGETYGVTSACEGSVPIVCRDGTSASSQRLKSEKAFWPRMETGGGSALDWFYHELKVPYAYQLKLRDTGSYGFLLPSENITPTGKEAFSAVEYFGNFLAGDNGIEGFDEVKGVHDDTKITHPKHHEKSGDEERVTFEEDANDRKGTSARQGEIRGDWELRRRRRSLTTLPLRTALRRVLSIDKHIPPVEG